MALDTATWAEIGRLFCEGRESTAELARRFGITPGTLRRRAAREGWARPSAGGRARPPAPAAKARPATRAALVRRLYAAIDRKLQQLEARMASGEDASAADFERETRTIGTMIRNFEKVTELETDIRKPKRKQDAQGPAAPADAERLRGAIAERLERLQRQRNADGGSGATGAS